jgi:hypothetical protein
VDFALLQSLTRARTVRRHTPHEAADRDGHTLLGSFAPTAHQVTGSDRHRACLPGCAASSGFLSLLTLRSPRDPAGLVSYRRRSWGSPFRGFPFRSPGHLSAPLAPPGVLRRRSPWRPPELDPFHAATWRPVPLRGARSAPRARAWPVSSAPSGVSARIGSPYSGRRLLHRTMGADPLLGFHALQGFPPPRLDATVAASPLMRFVPACRDKPDTDASGSRSAGRLAGLSRDCRPSWVSCPLPGSHPRMDAGACASAS